MGYFDGLVSGSFKRDDAGRTLFYPYGILGRGKRVPTEEEAQSLKSALKTVYMVILPLIIVLAALRAYIASFAIVVLFMIAYRIWISRKTAGWEFSDVKMTYAESAGNSAVALGSGWLICLLIGSLLFVAGGLAIIVLDPKSLWVGLSSLLFFGACAASFTYRLYRRQKA
jgi:hypothetical protein